jgi:hypothetical protein
VAPEDGSAVISTPRIATRKVAAVLGKAIPQSSATGLGQCMGADPYDAWLPVLTFSPVSKKK